MNRILAKLTVWRVITVVVLAAGAIATYIRFFHGLGAATNLSDRFPWGLWIGFDVLCGVGLAAGGFTLAAVVHIFNIRRFEPILRPTILTAFLGYLLVIVALMFDLGRPLQIWHAIIMWNHRSVMFEVAWCVMLYTAVLSLEFLPVVLEKFRMNKILKVMHKVSIPLIILGVILSTLHQSSLGSLYLIVPEKLYALWYSPYLPVMFYISAIGVGCAMIIFESFLSSRAFRKSLEIGLLTDLARASVAVLAVYATIKFVDLNDRGLLGLLFVPRMETYLYWLEVGVGIIVPIVLFAIPKLRQSRGGLFAGATMIIVGFIVNRLNITVTGMEAWAGTSYFPSWMEIAVTLSIVVAGFLVFRLAAKYLPLFAHERHPQFTHPMIEDLDRISRPTKESVIAG